MGNCITFQRVVSWVDDGEWDFLEDESPEHCPEPPKFQEHAQPQATTSTKSIDEQDQKKPAEVLSAAATKSTHEVRIKITKKQLAELLEQAESKGLPVQDVLASLLETGKPHRVKHRIGQCWRPALQSIPEIVE
ncbi:hypothetical protein LUZ63_000702 [Rhynchospora breviuscula]|uniref:Uncharacterized protein n=1 Tax=Rhynchospora breviuscula TaxID=2022672 RepID=A0A9Q0CVW9_9POAL|nr:hypothetical protein LUZ63_000702 [Rhynchospora breviuscula]